MTRAIVVGCCLCTVYVVARFTLRLPTSADYLLAAALIVVPSTLIGLGELPHVFARSFCLVAILLVFVNSAEWIESAFNVGATRSPVMPPVGISLIAGLGTSVLFGIVSGAIALVVRRLFDGRRKSRTDLPV